MVKACVQSETLTDDGYENVNRHGDPDPGLHHVLAQAVKCLDPQVLLDPFERIIPLASATCKCERW